MASSRKAHKPAPGPASRARARSGAPERPLPARPRGGARAAGAKARLVCLGEIVAPHGVRGAVRVRAYTEEPEGLVRYGALTDAEGSRPFALRLKGQVRGLVIAEIEGVHDRDAAEALRGVRLCVPRERLPALAPDEYYHADLEGMVAERADGTPLGTVVAVHDFGAGPLLEIDGPEGTSLIVPFTAEVVPEVDLDAGRIVVSPPPGLEGRREAEPAGEERAP